MTFSVLVVDDLPDHRVAAGLTAQADGRFTVVGEAADGEAAVAAAQRLQPDVVVLDELLPGRTGLEVLPDLRAASPQSVIVLFSAADRTSVEGQARAAGPDAYVDKSAGPAVVFDVAAAALSLRGA